MQMLLNQQPLRQKYFHLNLQEVTFLKQTETRPGVKHTTTTTHSFSWPVHTHRPTILLPLVMWPAAYFTALQQTIYTVYLSERVFLYFLQLLKSIKSYVKKKKKIQNQLMWCVSGNG